MNISHRIKDKKIESKFIAKKGVAKMKFRTFKYNIIRAIKVINHAVNAETMKMLGGILIDANAPNMVELTAYSNDIKIKYYVRADVEQKGTVVCNPKYLMNISKGENMEVIISTDKDNVIEMKIGTYKQKWQGTVAENYPKISMPECNNELMLEQERFREILTKTVPFAAPTVGYRPQYNGVLFDIKNETLHNVSTDGKRMAHITTPVGTYGNMSFVITLPAAKELCRIESENPLLRIVVDNTNMRLLLDYSEFIVVASTFNENGYVKYDNMMNRESDITATVKRAEFMQMIERGKFVSEQGKTKVPVTLELKDDVLKCNGRNLRCQLKDEIDAKNGKVATHGWEKVSDIDSVDLCKELEQIGVKTIVYTDISKDGMLEGPNFDIYKELSQKTSLDIIASGGVTSIEDVKRLLDMNMYGAIIGKALYDNRIDLKEVLDLC